MGGGEAQREKPTKGAARSGRAGRADRPWVLLGQGRLSGTTRTVHPMSKWKKDHRVPEKNYFTFPAYHIVVELNGTVVREYRLPG